MIRRCSDRDFNEIHAIINDGAQAYRGVIPADCWKEPYMPSEELRQQIAEGVGFSAYEENGAMAGVMGIQPVQDVTLIRHAYVRSTSQKQGIGAQLLDHLLAQAKTPVLIGTWADARWAIRFYEKHGFKAVSLQQKDRLLRKYWIIPQRQLETSVVLADPKWLQANPDSTKP